MKTISTFMNVEMPNLQTWLFANCVLLGIFFYKINSLCFINFINYLTLDSCNIFYSLSFQDFNFSIEAKYVVILSNQKHDLMLKVKIFKFSKFQNFQSKKFSAKFVWEILMLQHLLVKKTIECDCSLIRNLKKLFVQKIIYHSIFSHQPETKLCIVYLYLFKFIYSNCFLRLTKYIFTFQSLLFH